MQEGPDWQGSRVDSHPTGTRDHLPCTGTLAITIMLAVETLKGTMHKWSYQKLDVARHDVLQHLEPIECKHKSQIAGIPPRTVTPQSASSSVSLQTY